MTPERKGTENDNDATTGASRIPFDAVWQQLLVLLCDQGKFDEAWALELRREERIQWEIEQEEGRRDAR